MPGGVAIGVPYTGAVADLDLGAHSLVAAAGRFADGIEDNAAAPLAAIDCGNRRLIAADGSTVALRWDDAANVFMAGAVRNAGIIGAENIFIGAGAGTANTLGNDNFFAGYHAGLACVSAKHNVCIGHEAGKSLVGGADNATNGPGFSNICIGYRAGQNLVGSDTGGGAYDNVFLGKSAGDHCTTGCDNIAAGHAAGYGLTSGYGNVLLGFQAGSAEDSANAFTGYGNICLGDRSGGKLTTGYLNVCICNEAGRNLTQGLQNVFIGYGSGRANTTGSYNTYLGPGTGKNNEGAGNVFIGYGGGVRQTAASNTLLVSGALFADAATEVSNSIIYGVMAASPLAQRLMLNAVVKFLSMTTAQRDALSNPVEGWMIYNTTTHTIDFYNGTAWKQIAGA
jgi:hypothetical protein